LTTDHVPSGFDPGRRAGTFVVTTKDVLLRPAAFFAAASGGASYRATQLLEQWSKMREEYYRAFTEVYGAG
jgi:hypothetical protein